MKKYPLLLIMGIYSSLLSSEIQTNKEKCKNLLIEGDKYLQRVPLCEITSEKHANIAMAYYKRYELCKNSIDNLENSDDFKIYQVYDNKPYICESTKK